jgi:hypothetical protein
MNVRRRVGNLVSRHCERVNEKLEAPLLLSFPRSREERFSELSKIRRGSKVCRATPLHWQQPHALPKICI